LDFRETDKLNVAVALLTLFVADTLTEYVPCLTALPEIIPVDLSTAKPGGKPVAAKLVGLFVAVMRYVKLSPTVACAAIALEMTGRGSPPHANSGAGAMVNVTLSCC
jgi:hypothetical protein